MIYDKVAMSNGVIFQRAVDILNTQMKLGLANMTSTNEVVNGILDAALVVPVSVNGAFACELFMKSMLPKDTWGHKLNDLFELLDNNLKEDIRDLTVERMKKINSEYCDANFQEDLVHNSNVFAEWRYFHEGNADSVGPQFILSFMKSIFNIANKEQQK